MNFDNIDLRYLQEEFYVNEETRQQTIMEYQDYLLKEQHKIISKLEIDNQNLRNLNGGLLEINSILKKQVANLKSIVEGKDRLINLLKNSIKGRISK